MAITERESAYFLTTMSALMLTDPQPAYLFDRFATKEIDRGKFNSGDTVQLNRYPMLGGNGLTESARALSETQTVGTSNTSAQTVQTVTVTLKEYMGPHNGTDVGPLVVTEKVLKQAQAKLLDGANPLNFFNSIGGMSLKNDHDRWHDRTLVNLLLTTTNTLNPDNVADGSTATTSTGSKFDSDDLKLLKEQMMSRNVPIYPDGYYYMLVSPRFEKHLKQDADFKEACYYYKPESQFKGEITAFEGFKIWTSNNIPTAMVNSLTAHQAVAFGPDSFGYGEGKLPLQIRNNKNDDYQRFLYLIWLVYRGYALLDQRFVYKLRTFAA